MTNILICTVGGSHQPIVSAINDLKPDLVIFICTDTDPASGKAGSRIQIEGNGNCIKAQAQDPKPSLPNIPAQTGLSAEQYEICCTLSDDLDRIYLDCTQTINTAKQRFPDANITADYTGGTKSMSAGLVMAALERQDIDLQLVTGNRSDLIKVSDGSETTAIANIEQIRFERAIAPYRQAWTRYAYSEAEAGLNQIKAPRNTVLRGEFTRFRDLSRAYAEWDNFNHLAAQTILHSYSKKLSPPLLQSIGILTNRDKDEQRETAMLFDLYLNAQRRAAQGRYDDAIARLYRLIEWTAQWVLKTHVGIETGNLPAEQIPADMNIKCNKQGKYQVGLFDAWQLVKHKTNGAAAKFIDAEAERLRNHLDIRNNSILAHGFKPVSETEWQTIHAWVTEQFIPMLLSETAQVGIKTMPAQLPNQYPLR